MNTRWLDRPPKRSTVPRLRWLSTIYLPLVAYTGMLGTFSPWLGLLALWTGFKYVITASGSSTRIAHTATRFLDDTTAVNGEFLWPLIIITVVSLGWVLSCPHTARP